MKTENSNIESGPVRVGSTVLVGATAFDGADDRFLRLANEICSAVVDNPCKKSNPSGHSLLAFTVGHLIVRMNKKPTERLTVSRPNDVALVGGVVKFVSDGYAEVEKRVSDLLVLLWSWGTGFFHNREKGLAPTVKVSDRAESKGGDQ